MALVMRATLPATRSVNQPLRVSAGWESARHDREGKYAQVATNSLSSDLVTR